MRNLLTLLLLATFGLGLVAGPHPCAPEPGGKRASPQASCHQAASSAASTKAAPATEHRSHSRGPKNCCDLLCQHACQMVALVGVQSALFVDVPVTDETAEETAPTFFRFASAIDHIPLA